MESTVRFVVFAFFSGLVTLLVHIYLYRRLFLDTSGNPRWRRAGVWVMTGLAVPLVLSWSVTRFYPMDTTFAVATAIWTWMGAATYLLFSFWVLGGARWVVERLARRKGAAPVTAVAAVPVPAPVEAPMAAVSGAAPARVAPTPEVAPVALSSVPARGPAPVDEERRRFLARATAGGAVLASGGVTGFGIWSAFHEPVVSEVAVRLPGLPRALDGYTIVHLSDIHVGPVIRRRFMDELVARCDALRPDLVCITGDLVDGHVPSLGPSVSALAELKARHGVYFVTGNHEYYWNAAVWSDALERMGIHVLRNRHVRIGDAAASFDLVGVDDWAARRGPQGYDLDAALKGRDPERASVLLAHQPSNWSVAAKAGMGLQLSGHTHGGQFFPFTLAVSAIWQHDAGHFQQGDRHLYVSRGTGFWGPPLRVGSPPEIVKVTLMA
ncbi:metallophosphoesterase [Pyxidicoccus fallax]|uniref:Metallophosphoesterase n=1 Tax=Pyxidicoccus fallax TaxID=394095 RepID=A0A848LWL3_9BACT|nr:metallophosphoesterase [Pyxidicoccus fallax]NMO22000.1 metallophosphoesterase [Pyxidicoccus fallax]NPC83454.1 metallophosphoesterase [Pyxidicoccus fallax]